MLVSVCTPSEGPCDLVLSEQWAQDFHDFSFVWTETALDFFLDGVHVNHIATSVLDARARPLNPWSAANPLPMQMRLNLAIPPGTEWNTASWPFLLEVDYVRYYGLPPPPAPPPDSPCLTAASLSTTLARVRNRRLADLEGDERWQCA